MELKALGSMKKKRESIRKEQENIERLEESEKWEFCGYDEEVVSSAPERFALKKLAAGALTGILLITGLSGIQTTNITEVNPYVVEAKTYKKDKKKPTITYKDKKIKEVEKGKNIKNLGATAKDNVDGNVTKKLKVIVKKGSKSYSSIAKKIEKNKSVKFTDIGTYKITYTVKDKAGNKATKTRKIKVVKPKEKTPVVITTEEITTQPPTTQEITTEKVTTEAPTTQNPTTEDVTTETPTTEEQFVFKDLPEPIVGDNEWNYHAVVLNNGIYTVVNDPDWKTNLEIFHESMDVFLPENNPLFKPNIQNDYEYLMLSRDCGLISNAEYLKYLGKIEATNRHGNALTPRDMVIYSPFNKNNVKDGPNNIVSIYMAGKEDQVMIPLYLNIVNFDKNKYYDENSFKDQGYELLSKEPLVYGKKRVKTNVHY